jgi:hypothetical protein
MQSTRPVIVLSGQVYLDEEKNRYVVVTKKQGEVVTYRGAGFAGMLEDETFAGHFLPVDPADLTQAEVAELQGFCAPGTILKTGYIKD